MDSILHRSAHLEGEISVTFCEMFVFTLRWLILNVLTIMTGVDNAPKSFLVHFNLNVDLFYYAIRYSQNTLIQHYSILLTLLALCPSFNRTHTHLCDIPIYSLHCNVYNKN